MIKPLVPGGYILLSRNLLRSDIWNKPPLYLKIWVYLLSKAQHQNYKNLKRGQLRTSIPEIQEAMSYMVGYRKQKPSRKQVWTAIEWLRNSCLDSVYDSRANGIANRTRREPMIETTKATHGILINVVNYELYQDPKSYEGNNEGANEQDTNGTRTEQEGNNINKNVKNDKNDNKRSSLSKSKVFDEGCKEFILSAKLKRMILRNNPKARVPKNLQKWAEEIDRMMRLDKRTYDEVDRIIDFSQNDPFWQTNILSAAKLRSQFDTLYMKAEREKKASETSPYPKVILR